MEIQINKDIGKYEAKNVGPFTYRQALIVAAAAPVCIMIYARTSDFLPVDAAGFLTFLPAIVAWLFGWCKPYGMPMEQFLKSAFVSNVLAPANRKYKTGSPDTTSSNQRKKKYKRPPEGVA